MKLEDLALATDPICVTLNAAYDMKVMARERNLTDALETLELFLQLADKIFTAESKMVIETRLEMGRAI